MLNRLHLELTSGIADYNYFVENCPCFINHSLMKLNFDLVPWPWESGIQCTSRAWPHLFGSSHLWVQQVRLLYVFTVSLIHFPRWWGVNRLSLVEDTVSPHLVQCTLLMGYHRMHYQVTDVHVWHWSSHMFLSRIPCIQIYQDAVLVRGPCWLPQCMSMYI